MSGSRPSVGIRISAEGAEQARRQIEALGPAGETALRRVAVASAAASPEMQRLATASDVANRAFVGMGGTLGRIGATFTGVSGVAAGLTAGFAALGAAAAVGAVQIAKAGDTATATLARLSSATGGLAQAQAVYERLFTLSQQTGVSVAESAGSFARFSVAAKEIGGTNDQVLRLVSGIQKAGIVAGASAQETGAAVQQLGQALASGTLQGDELRSLLENMPQLAQALARELGVGIGQLRQMGSEGKLTADTVFPALLRASEKMNAEFDKMPVTMSRAKDILLAATEDFGARLDRITGLSQTFARFMQQGASALRAAGAYIAPNERESADQGVEAAARQRANVLRQIEADRTASAYGTVAPGLQQALDIADADLSAALARQNALRRDARELERAEAADAAQQAGDARRVRLGIEVRDVAEFADKRLKIARETAEKLKKINDAEAAGVTTLGGTPGVPGARFDAAAARAGVLREQREELEKLAKEEAKGGEEASKAAAKRQEVIDKLNLQVKASEEALRATQSGTGASREAAVALEIEARIREAGIPGVEKRTEAEKKAAEAIGVSVRRLDELATANDKAKEAARKAEDTRKEAEAKVQSTTDDVVRYAGDRFADLFSNTSRGWAGVMDNFYTLAKQTFARIAAEAVIRPIVTPIVQGLFGDGGLGSASSLGNLLGLSNLLPSGGLLGSLGLSGGLGGLSTSLFGTAGLSPATASLFGDVSGIGAAATAGTPGLLGTYGTSLLGGSALTLGGAFSGIGGGFGVGNLVGSLVANSQAQRTNSMIGAGLGSLGGFLIGGPLGGLIGGALGGGLGGLIGPKDSVRGWSYDLRSTASTDATGWEQGGGLRMGNVFYNESGKAQFDQANQTIAAINAYMEQAGLTVSGARAVGGNKNGPDGSWGGAASFGEALSALRFQSKTDTRLTSYLGGQAFDDPAKLQQAVEGFKAAAAAIDALGAESVPAFTAALKAVNDNFDNGVEQAKKYGLAEDNLTTARAKALAAIESQRAETLRQSEVSLSIRRLTAGGSTQEAELARQAEAARQELDSFGKSLDALALTAADRAQRLVDLEEVQAAERAAIIARYGEQAATALRQAGGSIRQYLDSLATGTAAGASPADRLAAAQSTYQRDLALSAGGDRDALGRVTGSADALLSAARDNFASSPAFQTILGAVKTSLGNLPVVQSYDALQTASLAAIQQAIVNGTLNTSTVILPSGNLVTVSGLADLGAVSAGLASLNTNLVAATGVTNTGLAVLSQQLAQMAGISNNALATAVQGNASLISLGVYLAAANVFAADLNWRINHLEQLGEAINGNISLGNLVAANSNVSTAAGLAALAKIATDASAASVAGLATVAKVSADGAGAGVAAQSAGNTIAASAANAHTLALGALSTNVVALGNAHTGLLVDINTSLGKVDASARDINASLATVDGRVAAVQAAQSAGNVIAVDASAASVAGFVAANTIAAQVGASTVAALNAANTIAASNTTLLFQAIGVGNTLQASGDLFANTQRAQMLAEIGGLRQQVAQLTQLLQQVGVVIATEVSKGTISTADGLQQVKSAIKNAA